MKKCYLVLIFLCCLGGSVFAQISDSEVKNMVKQAYAEGKSKEEIAVMLLAKGVSREQMERLKADYEKTEKEKSVGNISKSNTRERLNVNYAGVAKDSSAIRNKISDVFGRAMFRNNNLTFEPQLNIPTPNNYVLGPGDEIVVDIWGNSEMTLRQVISPEGTINVSNLGPLYLNGKNIREAAFYLKTMFSRIFSDLSGQKPGTFLKLSLGQIRSIRVNIVGEVVMPGTYTLPSLATLYHALYAAGGVNDMGTLRNIYVYRKGVRIARIDVYDYILNGDNKGDIRLEDGDLISIATYDKLVVLKGELKRPMTYEMKEGETLSVLLNYAGGFSGDAYKSRVTVRRKGDKEFKLFTVENKDFGNFVLWNGDSVTVNRISDRYENRVTLTGAVKRPGDYALGNKIRTVRDLMEAADGPKGDAFLTRAVIYREKEDLTKEVLSVDMEKLLAGEIEDMELRPEDQLYIPSKNAIREGYVINIKGEVRNPGEYDFMDNMTLEDAVIRAGGLKESASVVRVDVARRIKDPKGIKEVKADAELYSFALKDNLVVDGIRGFVLEPFDEIYVRRSPAYREQQNVTVKGEVLYAGVYAKEMVNSRISELVKRAGGITSKAYVKGARLMRKMTPEQRFKMETALRLSKTSGNDSIGENEIKILDSYIVAIELEKALANPGSDDDVVMEEGDELIVPAYDGTVRISGAVMSPNTVVYKKGMKFKDCIENAGGFGFRAKKRKAFVIYMNGKIAVRKIGRNPKIEPGCEIIVPMKVEDASMDLAKIMSLNSSFTSMAAMITYMINTATK